jgi:hypothetical protein
MPTCDTLLDLWFKGLPLLEVSERLDRAPEWVVKHIRDFRCSKEKAEAYEPMQRRWRGGRKITKREQKFIRAHEKRGIPVTATARLLQRKPNEIRKDFRGEININRMKEVAPTCDILLAHRYLFYCAKHPVITDQAYDLAKYEEIEFGAGGPFLLQPASDKVTDYPPHIRSLAHYIQYKDMDNKKQINYDQLPAYFAPAGYFKRKKK